MHEKKIEYHGVIEKYWEKNQDFLKLNKSGSVPFLIKKFSEQESQNGRKYLLLSGINAISEFIDNYHRSNELIPNDAVDAADVRKMIDWVNIKFYNEVVSHFLNEKIVNFFKTKDLPDQSIINIASKNLASHIDYFGFLISKNGWIAMPKMSLADIVLAAHVSILDYLGCVNWIKMTTENQENFKEWYRLMKSRPSFRSILQDVIPGFDASSAYRDLDFV